MAYTQGKNPISRKTSPLNVNNPFKRVSPLNMADGDVKHRDMSKDQKKEHKAKMHGRDPEQEQRIREEEGSQENNIPMGPERKSSSPLDLNGEELTAYKDVAPEDIPGYDDGANDTDYEAKDMANEASGAQYTDEEAEAAFDKMKYTTDANIRKGAGVDLGTISSSKGTSRKASPLNDGWIKQEEKMIKRNQEKGNQFQQAGAGSKNQRMRNAVGAAQALNAINESKKTINLLKS